MISLACISGKLFVFDFSTITCSLGITHYLLNKIKNNIIKIKYKDVIDV